MILNTLSVKRQGMKDKTRNVHREERNTDILEDAGRKSVSTGTFLISTPLMPSELRFPTQRRLPSFGTPHESLY